MLKHFSNGLIEAGCDEAGRGCLAGPVVAAAVILPKNFYHEFLNDSKKLSEKKRNEAEIIIKENAFDFAIAEISPEEIDKINILKASIKAMHKALDNLRIIPEIILVDGNKFYSYKNIPHNTIVKGDAQILCIAAASILAKTHRDRIMKDYHYSYPQYNFLQNKGYPTLNHRNACFEFGFSQIHRKSFKIKDQMKMF